jgi:FtsP/CotA-like multicopper oxidase with cupredoxin domain
MSTAPRASRGMSASSLVVFGVPIALAALLIPALLILGPKPSAGPRQDQPTTTQSVAASSQPEEVHLKIKEWSFTPNTLQLPTGQPVTLVLDNSGQLDHDVTIPSLGVSLKAAAGKSASQTITASTASTYDFLCSLPGHKEAGMQGKVVVADAAAAGSAPAHDMSAMPGMSDAATTMPSHAAIATTATKGNQPLAFHMDGATKVFDLKAEHLQWEVLPGEFVDAYGYAGADGQAEVPGPLIRVTEGDHVRVNFTNELPEPTVIHFHGPKLPNGMDGVADVTQKRIEPGETFTYEFDASPTGTFMYHTHYNSAEQEGKGLYGIFQVDPKEGARIQSDVEVFQVLSELGGYYLINGKAFPATEPIQAKVGQRVLIHLVNLGQMTHPMHMHGAPFQVVGTDGYPVPAGQELTKDVINIGPGERYDLLMNANNPGTWLFHCHILTHVQNHGVEPGGMITVVKVTQ